MDDIPISTTALSLSQIGGAISQPDNSNAKFIPNRVFLNNVDTFNGKHLSDMLADQTLGGKSDDNEFGEEELGEGEIQSPVKTEMTPPIRLEVVGTVTNPDYHKTEDVKLVLNQNCPEFVDEVLKCGFIIIDITADESEIALGQMILNALDKMLDDAKEEAPKEFERNFETRVFILLSTVMTWAKTKPVDPDDPDVPFVETDFKKRKPHPNYKDHIALEKDTVLKGKKHKTHLHTYVVASGIIYGFEEQDLHYLFKMAWNNAPELPVIENGRNSVPLIHVKDLSSVICELCLNVPKKKYLLAVEQAITSQNKIVKAISKTLSRGRIKNITKEESFLIPNMTQSVHDRLIVNLKMEPGFIVSDLDIKWHSELSFAENIPAIVKEYKESRKLQPIRILLHGPPASGKTTVAKKLCDFYKIHYISIPELINESLENMHSDILYINEQIRMKEQKTEEENAEEVEEEEEEEDLNEKLEEITAKLKEIEHVLEESPNKSLPGTYIIQFVKDKLSSNTCQNQGYVLDGYPMTAEETMEIFEFGAEGDEGEEEEEEEEESEKKAPILPDFVVSLEASDDFLIDRVIQLSEAKLQEMDYTEERIIQKLKDFRANNTDENTMLNIFDEREIHPIVINVAEVEDIFALLHDKIGKFRGYPPSKEELDEMARTKREEIEKMQEAERQAKQEMEERAKNEKLRLQEEWMNILQILQGEEQKLLAAQSKPLREYLMKFVFPILTKGLVEVAHIKPSDPVDFLAEYLFKENPEGRMFDPSYVAAYDNLIDIIDQFQDKLNLMETDKNTF